MVEEKVPVFVVRKATKKDLPKLNKEFYSDKKTKLLEEELNKIIVMEINGRIRGMTLYNPETQSFFEITNDPIIREFMAGIAKYEVERKKSDKEMERLIRKYGTKKLAQMYEEKMEKLVQKLKNDEN